MTISILAIFLWRADGVFGSHWTAHIVIIPFASLVVSCAAVAAGDAAVIPVTALFASFVVQTDVALLPCAAVVIAVTLVVAARRRARMPSRTLLLPSATALAGLLLVWLPTIVEQIDGAPGNLTRMWRYFASATHPGQPLRTAAAVWADVTTAFVRPNLFVGWGAAYQSRFSAAAAVLGAVQIVILAIAAWRGFKTGRTFAGWLCVLCLLASLVAGESITRITDDIGDYQVFWMSVLGALGWSAALCSFVPRDGRTTSTIIDIVGFMERHQVHRPLFHITDDRWLDATCVILQAYKHHPNMAVDPRSVPVFGEALAPSGDEDVEVFITDADQLAASPLRGGSQLISAHDGLFLHVSPRVH